jgi:hypothetical protein
MEKTLNPVNLQRLYKTLQSLGYYPLKTIDRTTEWRKSQYHLFTKPFGKRGVKLKLHKDLWESRTFKPQTHKTAYRGKDIEQELQKIQQKYKENAKAH